MPRTFAGLMPLLAILALLSPGKAVAGPPEGVSGRMVLDPVPEGLRDTERRGMEGKRIEWLRRLAPSRDPRVAVELWEVFAWASGKREVAIRRAALECLAEYYVTRDGRPLSETKPSDTEWGPCVCAWWSKNSADVRRRAKQLLR